jgi:hypothetical protein
MLISINTTQNKIKEKKNICKLNTDLKKIIKKLKLTVKDDIRFYYK